MNTKSTNKIKLLIICVVCILVFFILFPTNANGIRTAVVNDQNGDIAFCYYDSKGVQDVIKVCLFTKDGEELYSKVFVTGMSPDMIFVDETLCMVVHYGTRETKYFYDREGNETYLNISSEEINNPTGFEGWDYCFGNFTLYKEDYEYRYEQPFFFRKRARLTITKGDTMLVIYESPEKD